MTGTILVLGGTGTVGSKLADALKAQGAAIRIATRNPKTADEVRFDFADPATFGEAFEGVDRAFLLSPTGYSDPIALLTPVLDYAIERGIKVVFQTAFGVNASDDIPFRQLELKLERSGVPYVILRPNWFSDNFGFYWLAQVHKGELRLPAADGKTSFIDARDVADCAAAALLTDRFDKNAYDLTGPEAVSYGETAEILSSVLGRRIAYQPVDDETFVSEGVAAGLPEDYATMIAGIFSLVRMGVPAHVTDSVRTMTGREPRRVDAYIRDNAAHLGKANASAVA